MTEPLRTAIEASIHSGKFDADLYRWLMHEATAEEGAAMLAIIDAWSQRSTQISQVQRIVLSEKGKKK